MKGKPRPPAWRLPKRLGSLMVIVAASALSFQMIRGVTSQPGVTPPRPAPRLGFRTLGSALPPVFPPVDPRHVAERPFLVVENPGDARFLKTAPEGIDDAMTVKPETLKLK